LKFRVEFLDLKKCSENKKRNMKIISSSGLRGGTGTTTIAMNLAHEMSKLGGKVLLANLDYKPIPFIFAPENIDNFEEADFDLVDMFKSDFDIQNRTISAVVDGKKIPNLDLLISNYSMDEQSRAFLLNFSEKDLLLNNLQKLNSLYDWIIIDCPSEKLTDSIILKNIIFASDLIISPFSGDIESIKYSDILYEKVKEIKSNCNSIIFVKNSLSYETHRASTSEKFCKDLIESQQWKERIIELEIDFSAYIVNAFNKNLPVGLSFGTKDHVMSKFKDLAKIVNDFFFPPIKQVLKNTQDFNEGMNAYEMLDYISNDKELKEKFERMIFEKKQSLK